MKNRLVLLIVLTTLIGSFLAVQAPAWAATQTITATVRAYRLNVRAADKQTAAKVAILKERAIVTVLGRNAAGSWLKIQTSDGITGWVKAVFLKVAIKSIKSLPIVS